MRCAAANSGRRADARGRFMSSKPRTEPANVFVADGYVVLDGPNALAATFTVQAARDTAARMEAAATLADLHQGFALDRRHQ